MRFFTDFRQNRKKQIAVGIGATSLVGAGVAFVFFQNASQEWQDYILHNLGDYIDGIPEVKTTEEITTDLIIGPFEFEPQVIDYDPVTGQPFSNATPQYETVLDDLSNKLVGVYTDYGVPSMNSPFAEMVVESELRDANPALIEDGLTVNINPDNLGSAISVVENSGLFVPTGISPMEESRVIGAILDRSGVDLTLSGDSPSGASVNAVNPAQFVGSVTDVTPDLVLNDGLFILEIESGDNLSDLIVERIVEVVGAEHGLTEAQQNRFYVHVINHIAEINEGLENPNLIHPGEKITVSLSQFDDIISGSDISLLDQPVSTPDWLKK